MNNQHDTKAQDIGSYMIYGLTTGQITSADVITAFDGDAQPERYFAEPDNVIIGYLIQNNGIADIVAFYQTIGDAGRKRMDVINQCALDVDVNLTNAVVWAAELQQMWQQREGIDTLRMALTKIQAPGVDPIDILNRTVARLSKVAGMVRRGEVVGGYDAYTKALQILDSHAGIGADRDIDTGTPIPLERGKLATLGGVWGSGKTALAAQMTFHAASQDDQVVLWIQTEMSEGDMLLREAYRRCQVTQGNVRQLRRKLMEYRKALKHDIADPSEERQIRKALAEAERFVLSSSAYNKVRDELAIIRDLPVRFVTDPNLNMIQVMAIMQSVRAEFGRVDIVAVDHVEYLRPANKVKDNEKVKAIYADTKLVMREFPDTAFLFLQHLNTNIFRAEDKSIIPSMSDFNYGGVGALDSGYIIVRPIQHLRQLKITDQAMDEMPADKLAALKREAYVHVVKARAGESNTAIPFEFFGEFYEWRVK